MDNDKLKYRIRRNNRYKGFDYSSNGAYYVTICADKKRHIFGNVENGVVFLSELGRVIDEQINELQNQPNINIMSHIVMPNHLHLLVMLQNDDSDKVISLTDMIRILKSKVYVEYRKVLLGQGMEPGLIEIWQRSYWDHIVRKEEDLVPIDEYIQRNPEFWNEEIDNPNTQYPTNRVVLSQLKAIQNE